MLSSIHPFGERARAQRWGLTVAAYLVGSALGGAAIGLVLGGLGAVVLGPVVSDPVALLIGGVATLVLAGVELARPRRLPSWPRQVNEEWLTTYRGWVYGLGYGAQLGTGVVTYITTAAVYAGGLWVVLGHRVGLGLVVGMVFGLARGLVLLSGRHIVDPATLRAHHLRLQQLAPVARRVVVAGLAVSGVAALAAGVVT